MIPHPGYCRCGWYILSQVLPICFCKLKYLKNFWQFYRANGSWNPFFFFNSVAIIAAQLVLATQLMAIWNFTGWLKTPDIWTNRPRFYYDCQMPSSPIHQTNIQKYHLPFFRSRNEKIRPDKDKLNDFIDFWAASEMMAGCYEESFLLFANARAAGTMPRGFPGEYSRLELTRTY